ncbi:MAG: GNAT family N-acetyltransferase, partial [Bacilli bacterium]
MNVRLQHALPGEETRWHTLQVEAFQPLLDKYGDVETNPAAETVEHVRTRLEQPFGKMYFILHNDSPIGGVRVVQQREGEA